MGCLPPREDQCSIHTERRPVLQVPGSRVAKVSPASEIPLKRRFCVFCSEVFRQFRCAPKILEGGSRVTSVCKSVAAPRPRLDSVPPKITWGRKCAACSCPNFQGLSKDKFAPRKAQKRKQMVVSRSLASSSVVAHGV